MRRMGMRREKLDDALMALHPGKVNAKEPPSLPLGIFHHEGPRFTGIQQFLRIEVAEQFDELRDQARPSRLMAGSQARAIIAVEVFVEEQVVLPQRIRLEFLHTSKYRTPARLVPQEDSFQPMGNFL